MNLMQLLYSKQNNFNLLTIFKSSAIKLDSIRRLKPLKVLHSADDKHVV